MQKSKTSETKSCPWSPSAREVVDRVKEPAAPNGTAAANKADATATPRESGSQSKSNDNASNRAAIALGVIGGLILVAIAVIAVIYFKQNGSGDQTGLVHVQAPSSSYEVDLDTHEVRRVG